MWYVMKTQLCFVGGIVTKIRPKKAQGGIYGNYADNPVFSKTTR